MLHLNGIFIGCQNSPRMFLNAKAEEWLFFFPGYKTQPANQEVATAVRRINPVKRDRRLYQKFVKLFVIWIFVVTANFYDQINIVW